MLGDLGGSFAENWPVSRWKIGQAAEGESMDSLLST